MNIALTIEQWPIDRLAPYVKSARKNDGAVDRMCSSIREYGFRIPVLARSDGEVIDGHLRLKAARKLGLQELPVIVCDDWTPAQVKAFRLLVNRSASWAEWDPELLALEFAELDELDFDLSFTGFDSAEIDCFLGHNEAGEDGKANTIPEPPDHLVTKTGDTWICGAHRISCGDATNRESVVQLLGSARPPLMVTDPPYGVEYDPQWRERAGLGEQRQRGTIVNDDRVDWTAAFQLFSGDVAYVWHAGIHCARVATSLGTAGFEIRAQIIWAKPHFVISRGHYHWQHEPAFYAVRKGRQAHWCGDRTQSTLWETANLNPFGGGATEEIATGHGNQKPVELIRRPLLNHTRTGEAVYDPFVGSGTTVIAAELTGRICYGMDIDPRYVDMCVTRWQAQTGREATLDGDGRGFTNIELERQACRPSPTANDTAEPRMEEALR